MRPCLECRQGRADAAVEWTRPRSRLARICTRTGEVGARHAARYTTSLSHTKSLRQELNPHLGRTKGACLPLTLRRHVVNGDGGTRTHIGLVASEVLFQLSDVPALSADGWS
jgi:hypothetical protein